MCAIVCVLKHKKPVREAGLAISRDWRFLLLFLILLILLIPFTRAIVGTTLGAKAIVPPLVVAAAPYIARMVESSFREVDAGVIEAAQSMGATTWQIIWKVLLPEAKPSLFVGAAISITTILG